MPTVDFDAPALMAVLDIPEMAGVPPELVEQLRCLVRAREAWGENEDHPVNIWRPDEVRVHRPLDAMEPIDGFLRDTFSYRLRGNREREVMIDAEWTNGDRLSGRLVQSTVADDGSGYRHEAIVEIGGKRLAFSVPPYRTG